MEKGRFENILDTTDRNIQIALRQLDYDDLALALWGTSADVKDKILRNMSIDGIALLMVATERVTPAQSTEVESAQNRMMELFE
jgi:flagellar motor switch protein FliG